MARVRFHSTGAELAGCRSRIPGDKATQLRREWRQHHQYPTRSDSDINYGGNFPYDVISPIGSNGEYWYGRVRYTF